MSVSAERSRSPDVDDRWRQLEDLFAEALELPPGERDAFIGKRCHGDDEMAGELRSLLSNADTDAPLVDSIASALSELSRVAPARIGPYRLGEMIGQGGMGTVYAATRDDAEFTREVAIKVLKPFASPEHVTRFRDERQILATLDHPAIVKLLDGGRTDGGSPYLVMERVAGVPITQWAKGKSTRERVELIARVAAGVGYAHGKLVVHRDLKPSNLLVEASGAPKLLDFGIAKLLGGERETPDTRTGMPLLTPEYASPEQARGEPITVATDIYSLGAVFYEVLVGKPPQATGSSVMQTLAAICDDEPPLPGISRDLDSIVLKMLQKKPADRYASIAELIADLERYLGDRPVLARVATARYRALKFVARNKGKLAIVTLIAGVLVGAAVVSLGQAQRATEAARVADVERNRLVFERGWQELAAGHAGASLPWLLRALEAEDSPAVRFSLAEALRPFDGELVIPFPRGVIDAKWISDHRIIITGRGGYAIFDDRGRPVGPSSDAFVWLVELGPEGSYAVAYEKRLVIYDANGVATSEFPTNGFPMWLGFLDDGSLLIAEPNRVRIVRDRVLFERAFEGVTAGAARARIAVATGGTLYELDASGRELWTRVAQPAGINAMRFAPDGRLVTTAMDASVKVWSQTGEQLAEFAGHNSFIEAMTIDRAGTKIATGGRDGTVKIWSIGGKFLTELRGHDYGVTGVDFSADGTRLISTGGDQTHRIWDLSTAFLDHQIEGKIGGGSAASSMAKTQTASFSPDGTRVLAAAGASVKIVRPNRGALLAKFDIGHQPRSAAYSPDGREIAMCGPGLIEIRTRQGERLASVPGDNLLIWDIVWSPDGKHLAYAADHGALIDRASLRVTKLVGHPGRVNRVQFHDSRLLTAGDSTARIWDVASARQLAVLEHPGRVSAAVWDRSGTRIYTVASDMKLRIWDATTHAQLSELDVEHRFLDLVLSPDETRIALGAHDGTIAIWELASRTKLIEITGHTGPVTQVAWSPDGALLASSADDQSLRVWDPESGRQLAIRRSLDGAMSVMWSADGTELLSASTDGWVRIWDAHRETRSLAELQRVTATLR